MADLTKNNPQHNAKADFETTDLCPNASSTSLDKAAIYLYNHAQSSGEGSINPRELLWKIDWRIIPIAGACYTMQFLDRANINVGVALIINPFAAEYCIPVCSCYGVA